MDLRSSLEEPVSQYTDSGFVRVSIDDSVSAAAKEMQKAGATEALVMRDGGLVGILTERDILYKVVAAGLNPTATNVGGVMTAPVETVEDSSKVGEAIARMSRLGIRRLAVTKGGRFVGLVTQKSLVSGGIGKQILLPELAKPGTVVCPYCNATMKDSRELSVHIDSAHLGRGLLEGDRTKW